MVLPALDCPRLLALEFTDIHLCANGSSYLKGAPGTPGLKLLGEDTAAEITALREVLASESGGDMTTSWDGTLLVSGVLFRVARRHSVGGTEFFLRRAVRAVPTLKDLGMRQDVVDLLLAPDFKQGMVIFCGPPGSGKTTSAGAAIADRLAAFGGSAACTEDPPELPLHGPHGDHAYCYQYEVGDRSFGEVLVDQLREAGPDIFFLGELRRSVDVAEALQASANGRLVFVTSHAPTVPEALLRLDFMGRKITGEMSRFLLADGVKLVVKQRLEGELPRRRLVVESLAVNSKGIQGIIRDGRYWNLGEAIEKQRHDAMFGRPRGLR